MKILEDEVASEDAYVRLIRRHFQDRGGNERVWSFVQRRGERGAVVILPVIRGAPIVLLLRQFRVPFDAWVLEFPAGLIDDGESPAAAAIRELAEETGISGRVTSLSPPLSSSAGLTTERIFLATVEVESTEVAHAIGRGPLSSHEDSEEIQLVTVEKSRALEYIAERDAAGDIVDVKLYLYCSMLAGTV